MDPASFRHRAPTVLWPSAAADFVPCESRNILFARVETAYSWSACRHQFMCSLLTQQWSFAILVYDTLLCQKNFKPVSSYWALNMCICAICMWLIIEVWYCATFMFSHTSQCTQELAMFWCTRLLVWGGSMFLQTVGCEMWSSRMMHVCQFLSLYSHFDPLHMLHIRLVHSRLQSMVS